jgi:hypothetical protein
MVSAPAGWGWTAMLMLPGDVGLWRDREAGVAGQHVAARSVAGIMAALP